ncbi:MAG: PAS domain-containing sensor histidine kinase [Candidatus Thorarchaeota archaeon]
MQILYHNVLFNSSNKPEYIQIRNPEVFIITNHDDKFYRLITDKLSDVIYTLDMDLNITFINEAVNDLLGYTPKEFLTKELKDIMTYDSRKHVMKMFSEALALEKRGDDDPASDFEVEMIKKDGTRIWVELSRTFLRDTNEDPTGILGVARDITSRKINEERLRTSEASLAEAQRIAQLGIWDWNFETGEDIWSDECYKLFGLDSTNFNPTLESFLEYVHPDDRESVLAATLESRKTGTRYHIAHRIIRFDGEVRYVQEDAEVLFDAEGKPYRMLGTMRDITVQKIIEAELLDARARAEFFNDLLAHDISNIHQGLMVSLELILTDEHIPERTKVFAENALVQVERSIELIRRVRKFATVESEDQETTPTDISASLVHAKEAISHSFPQKIIRINTNISEGKFIVNGNDLLFDVWFNLLHNAAKFDKRNNVIVDIMVKDADDTSFYIIRTDDRGSGITSERKEQVLERLERSATSSSGIGLTLVKQIIQTYGGRIWIEDRVDDDSSQGVSIVFLIPKA